MDLFCLKMSVIEKMNPRTAALWGMFIGDAMAMPAHWFYSPTDIKSKYGKWLDGYTAPCKKHPSSIMNLSAVGGSGRSGWGQTKQKPVIGNVILHDKLKYWTSGDRGIHYHQGMSAGDNTLNAITALETAKILQKLDPNASKNPAEMRAAVMANYVKFMTTPGSHNDTYAESFHRSFFSEWAKLDDPPKTGEDIVNFCEKRYKEVESGRINEDHQLPVIGGLVLTVPWILHYSNKPQRECADLTVTALKLTHPAPSLMPFARRYAELLHSVVNGADLKEEALKAAGDAIFGRPNKAQVIKKFSTAVVDYPVGSEDRLRVYQEATAILGMACYIQGSMSSMLFLAHEYHDDLEAGTLGNANCGGENVHRGAALGALLAANYANKHSSIPEHLITGLSSHRAEIWKIASSMA